MGLNAELLALQIQNQTNQDIRLNHHLHLNVKANPNFKEIDELSNKLQGYLNQIVNEINNYREKGSKISPIADNFSLWNDEQISTVLESKSINEVSASSIDLSKDYLSNTVDPVVKCKTLNLI